MADFNTEKNRMVWIDIPVSNLDRACKFYSEVLGVEVHQEEHDGEPFGVIGHKGGNGGSLVIKKKDFGATDRLLTVYTKDFGKLLIKAKSVRKNQAKLRGHLELFMYSDLLIAQGKSIDVVIGAEAIDNFRLLRQRLPTLAIAYYFSELLDKLYILKTPLYVVRKGKKTELYYSKEEFIKKAIVGPKDDVLYAKGLGSLEMDIWEKFLVDEKNRQLVKLVGDHKTTPIAIERLFGNDSTIRKKWLASGDRITAIH